MTEFLIRIHSAILLITLEKPKKAGIRKAHFFKIVFEGYVAFRFSIVFLNFALGCLENTGTCQTQYTLSVYLLPFNLSRGPSISFLRDQEINFSLLIFFRAGFRSYFSGHPRLATSRPLGERSEHCLTAKRPIARTFLKVYGYPFTLPFNVVKVKKHDVLYFRVFKLESSDLIVVCEQPPNLR